MDLKNLLILSSRYNIQFKICQIVFHCHGFRNEIIIQIPPLLSILTAKSVPAGTKNSR